MASLSRILTGRTVYSNGSFAPTRGTVNPSGYIKRESEKRGNVNNNTSQTRSGLAQQALNRTLRNQISQRRFDLPAQQLNNQQRRSIEAAVQRRAQNIRSQPGNIQSALSNKPNLLNDYQKRYGNLLNKGGFQPKSNQNVGSIPKANDGANIPITGQPVEVGEVTTPYQPPNYMNINENGQLDLPYDESFSWEMIGQKQAMNQALLQLKQQEEMQGLEWANMRRDANKDFQDISRQNLNSAAARGMAFSSGYGNRVAETGNEFNNFINDLDTRHAMFKGHAAQSRSAIENAFNEFLRESALRRALELDDSAGDLGFGQDPVEETETETPATEEKKKKNKAPALPGLPSWRQPNQKKKKQEPKRQQKGRKSQPKQKKGKK